MTEDWETVEAEGLTVKGQIYVLQQRQIQLIKWQMEWELTLISLICLLNTGMSHMNNSFTHRKVSAFFCNRMKCFRVVLSPQPQKHEFMHSFCLK